MGLSKTCMFCQISTTYYDLKEHRSRIVFQDMEVTVHNIQNEEKPEMEPHILLLHKFFGQQFTERLLDSSYEIPDRPVHPLLLGREGYGADDYWRLLRDHSEAQMTQHITDIPGKLMSSNFSQFPPSKRLDRIRGHKKSLGLMARAAEINEERAMLMLANNPLTYFTEWKNKHPPIRYPSKDTLFTKKVNDLQKTFHLPSLNAKNANTSNEGISDKLTLPGVNMNYRLSTEEISHGLKPDVSKCHHNKKDPRYTIRSKRNSKSKEYTQMANLHISEDASPYSPMSDHRSLAWEPLTFTALMDSSHSLSVSGRGYFRHGQPTFWLVNSSFLN
ncbi:testis-specific gene 13 protein-like isoform X2 [Hyperolius riggenbachi]|uniref:testis-specific gene 13 protein-like isoform X2 n=1 Tax=Hyperolius riggenbachi TaxID=752182 RepID=UPI0035A32D5F